MEGEAGEGAGKGVSEPFYLRNYLRVARRIRLASTMAPTAAAAPAIAIPMYPSVCH